MIERIHDDGEEYGISPKAGDELQINYELVLKSIYTLNLLKDILLFFDDACLNVILGGVVDLNNYCSGNPLH